MDAPVSPAGLPAIGISAAREDTEEIASLPAMSVQDDGTDAVAIGPREGGQALPLTAEALAVMGLNDPRRNAPGAVSEWAHVTTPTHARASLAGSPQQFNSAQYSPSEFHNTANYYQNNVLAPSLHQQVLLQQNDSGPAVQAVAEARHSAIMAEAQSNYREQVTQLQAHAISSATQLRLELLQAEHRLQQQEEQLRAAGESLATKHSEEVSQMQKEVMEYKIRLHQAEAHASEIVRQAELELANRAKASQSHAENMTGELNHLKSEMGTVLQAHKTQSENVLRLERTNADLRARLAEAVAASPTNTVTVPPVEHPIYTPPGLMQGGGGPPGGDDSPHGSDGDDDESDDGDRRKKKKKDKKKKKKKRDSSDSSSSSSIGLSKKDLLKMLKKVAKSKKDKDNDDETEATRGRSKVKEAEKIVFPKFPQPENYRNWRLRAREAVVAASDRPDEAFEWLDEVWKEDTTEEYLRDPKGFTTLDAKILSAITNVLEGDFARQIDTFKEREGHEGRLVRGRQILHKLNAYLSTNALHGSVYDMEDLLNVVMINENLVQFIRNWDTVLSGMKKTPADDVLQPLFHRQVKKAKILSHDIAIYERAVDGSAEKTYEFLYNAVNRLIKIKRLERNRERIAKQAAAGMPSAPAPLKRVPKGFCIDFVRNGSCSKDQCTYKHQMPNKPRGRSQSKGKGKGRSKSPSGRGSPSPGRINAECKFFKHGKCNKGDKCRFIHKGQPSAPATGSGRESSGEKKKKKEKKENRRKKSRSSSKSSKGSRGSKGSKGSGGSRGSGGRRPKPSLPAAVCLLGALVASSAPQADALAFRKEVPIIHDQCSNAAHLAMASVRFSNTPEYHYIPTPVEDSNWRGVEIQPRVFTKEHPVKYRPKSDGQDVRDALATQNASINH